MHGSTRVFAAHETSERKLLTIYNPYSFHGSPGNGSLPLQLIVLKAFNWHGASGKSAFANRLDIGLIRQNITNSTVVTLPDNLRGYHIK